MPRPRLNQQQIRKRKETMIDAALVLVTAPGGWVKLTRAGIAEASGYSDGLVSFHLGSMDDIRRTLVKTATKREEYGILAQAYYAGHAPHLSTAIRAKLNA